MIDSMRAACIAAVCWSFAFAASAQDSPASAPKLLLVPAAAQGVDPVVSGFVDRGLQRSADQGGYVRVAENTAAATAVPADPTVVPSMVELWQRVHVSGADYAALMVVSARDGRYALELRVACRDGRGPFYLHASASNVELEQIAGRLLLQGLALADPSPAFPERSPFQTPVPEPTPVQDTSPDLSPVPDPSPSATPNLNPSPAPARINPYRNEIPNPNPYHKRFQHRAPGAVPDSPHTPYRHRDGNPYRGAGTPGIGSERVRLVAHDEVVIGTDRDGFVGALLGVRADYQMGPALYLGAYGGYANLPGRDTRAHSFLTYAQLEHRIPVGANLGIPSRIALGYLARNGAVLRLSSGFAVRIADSLEVVFDVLSPMFWVTSDTTLFSLNFGLEVGTRM